MRNQQATRATLRALPGLARVIASWSLPRSPCAPTRPSSNGPERAAEVAIRAALNEPGSVETFEPGKQPPAPVSLWLHPAAARRPRQAAPGRRQGAATAAIPSRPHSRDKRKRRAERVDMPQATNPFMLLFRAESLFSWAEFIKVDRPLDEDENEHAEKAANDLDILSIADDDQTAASRVRFDLDLPAEADDDLMLADGILLPEWDYRKQQLQPAHCRLQMLLARDAEPCALPLALRAPARRLRQQFQALTTQRARLRAQMSGSDLDIDACVRFATDKAGGARASEPGLYVDSRQQQRDLSCLLLADLSLSTDAWVNNTARVIEVIRDSLLLFGEALAATGDRFALYGFSSVRRDNVRFHLLKGFDERYDDQHPRPPRRHQAGLLHPHGRCDPPCDGDPRRPAKRRAACC